MTIQELIATQGQLAFEHGRDRERERIYKALYDYFRLFDGASNPPKKISESELMTLIKHTQAVTK